MPSSPLPRVAPSGPPPIPRAQSDSTGHPRRPLLVWVRTGTALVHIDGVQALRLDAGEGAWLPADGWDHRAIVTEPGTVAFPLWFQPGIGAGKLSERTQFDVPGGWQDWLIQHFNLQITPLGGPGYSIEAITDFLRRAGAGVDPWPALSVPAMPKAVGARAVAEELVRDPSLGYTVEQWAARVYSSSRTLRRDFHTDTGLTFEQWRLRCRLTAAAELLAAGCDADQTVARVGFASRNGFTRAFKQQFGPTPHEFSRTVAGSVASGQARRAAMAPQADDLVRLTRANGSRSAPDMLPPARTPPHTNDVHVLSWIYRGSGYLDVGDHRYERERGVATWIPAGVEHVSGLRENSVSLPLGDTGTGDLQLAEPLQVRFSPAWDDYLMFCSVSARSGLRPADQDHRRVLDLFSEQVAVQRALSVPMPDEPRARAAAMDYLRTVGTSDELRADDLPAEIHRAFREQTGMSFSRWRYAARMRIARELLVGGAKSSAVARRVGYRHLPTFSTAFSRFHGTSPREYQARERAHDRSLGA